MDQPVVGDPVGATVGVSELYCVEFVGENVGENVGEFVGERVARIHRHQSLLVHAPVLLRSVFIFSRPCSK